MTDKVQKIREEIERKLEVMQYQIHRKDAYKELKSILNYIDSFQEEPVNEELEEAIDEYAPDFSNSIASKAAVDAVRDAFKAGAKWQKEQMMAKAIDAKLLEGHLIRQKGVTHPLHVGDKVKVIVIKEDWL